MRNVSQLFIMNFMIMKEVSYNKKKGDILKYLRFFYSKFSEITNSPLSNLAFKSSKLYGLPNR